jgi:hypothetical protein
MLYLSNEYSVLKQAKLKESKNLSSLKNVYLSKNHVALEIETFEMDMRDFLEDHRDTRHMTKIF